MATVGLVIGKFYPPHKGHKYLIDTALGQVDHLLVLVCDTPGQAIPAKKRAEWIEEIHPQVTVKVIADIMDDENSQAWALHTKDFLGSAPDVIFTSEDYGDAYAKAMGCRHVKVDRERVVVPISATRIRNDVASWWSYLEPPVKAYLAKRVCIIGAESTGTTTVARDLAIHYETVWVPEFGRYYSEAKKFGDKRWSTDEFVFIARMQSEAEDKLAGISNKILICDTDAFATTIWHERYLNRQSAEVEAIALGRKYDLYIVSAPDIPFVQDGTRDGEHIRIWMHGRFLEALREQKKKFIVVTGSRQARLEQAVKVIDPIVRSARI